MSDVQYLNEFLESEINIDKTRLDRLNSSVSAVMNYVSSSSVFEEIYTGYGTQGSYAHRTIIKPSIKKKEFDADVLVFLTKKDGWEAADYIEEFYKEFRKSGVYREKVKRSTRCITIDYTGEFHIDIVPFFKRFFGNDQIVNKNTSEFESTDSLGYSEWLDEKNSTVGNDYLILTIRLLKYLRNIKQTFSGNLE
ncbi:MAG: hypothetical protein KZQ96_13575 [Candidatus Thiodiazotropha sp. (ex Lucinoma borealis)]|nr:hypothetical protein [Candidatus Thiodiazotropha sp. (ex Lucinoma borealis)]